MEDAVVGVPVADVPDRVDRIDRVGIGPYGGVGVLGLGQVPAVGGEERSIGCETFGRAFVELRAVVPKVGIVFPSAVQDGTVAEVPYEVHEVGGTVVEVHGVTVDRDIGVASVRFGLVREDGEGDESDKEGQEQDRSDLPCAFA